jgi:hypothetical protein
MVILNIWKYTECSNNCSPKVKYLLWTNRCVIRNKRIQEREWRFQGNKYSSSFWVVIPCSHIAECRYFWGLYFASFLSLHPEEGGSMIFRNIDILPHHSKILRLRKARLKVTEYWHNQRVFIFFKFLPCHIRRRCNNADVGCVMVTLFCFGTVTINNVLNMSPYEKNIRHKIQGICGPRCWNSPTIQLITYCKIQEVGNT